MNTTNLIVVAHSENLQDKIVYKGHDPREAADQAAETAKALLQNKDDAAVIVYQQVASYKASINVDVKRVGE